MRVNGCEVIVINSMDVSDTEELAADMMSLLASFSGKFYGKRSAERRKKRKVNIMEELLFNKVLGGEELVKDILNTDNVSSIRDQTGKPYWWNTIDKKKKYQVEKYEYERALQYYPIIFYIINEVI